MVASRWHPDQKLGIKPATRVTGTPTLTTEQRPGPVSGSFPLPQATGPVHADCIFKAPLSHICVSTGARGYLRHAREWGRLLCKCTFFPFLPPRVPRLRGVPPPLFSITWIPINMYVLYVHLAVVNNLDLSVPGVLEAATEPLPRGEEVQLLVLAQLLGQGLKVEPVPCGPT